MRSFIQPLVCAAKGCGLTLPLALTLVSAAIAQPPDSYWFAVYGTTSSDRFSEVRETEDLGLVLAGYTDSIPAHGYDFWLVKTDVAGQQLWSQTYGGTHDDFCYALEIAPGGDCILAGYTNYYPDNGQAGWVIKTDMNGSILWSREMGRAGYSAFYDVAITSDGEIILGGYQGNGTWLVKLSAGGDSLWGRTFGGNSGTGIAVCETQDGGFAVAGQVRRRLWLCHSATEKGKNGDREHQHCLVLLFSNDTSGHSR